MLGDANLGKAPYGEDDCVACCCFGAHELGQGWSERKLGGCGGMVQEQADFCGNTCGSCIFSAGCWC